MSKGATKNRVLLLENDLATAVIICRWLESHAHVTHLTTEYAAIEMIQKKTWDLVITDITSPGLNDIDITKLVKSVDPITQVLIVTRSQKIDFILKALEEHADGLLFKPLNEHQFIETVTRLVEISHNTRQTERKIILGISAHPDDIEIGCGGTLAVHHLNGDEIHLLTLSQGESGGDPELRFAEAKASAHIQSATLHMYHLADTKISEGLETITIIEDVVALTRPTHIYTHSVHDTHKDHRNVHLATLSACRQISNIFCYQSPSTTIDFKPNLFMQIPEYALIKKIEAIACFKSQVSIRPYLSEEMILATARYWSRYNNYQAAEPLEIIRQRVSMTEKSE